MERYALEWLEKQLKKTKISIDQAKSRPGVKAEELDNLRRKIDTLHYLLHLVARDAWKKEETKCHRNRRAYEQTLKG